MAVHHCRSRGNSQLMRRGDDLHPARGRQFVGAEFLPHAIIENFRRRPRDASEAFCLHHAQVIAQRHPGFRHAVINFHWRKSMHVHFGNRVLDGAQQVAVEKSIEIFRQPALNAHFRRAALPSLPRPSYHFLGGMRIRICSARPSCKPAETAAHETNIGEVQIAIHHVRDDVAHGLAPQVIRDGYQGFQSGSFRGRKLQALVEAKLFPVQHRVEARAYVCLARRECIIPISNRAARHARCILPAHRIFLGPNFRASIHPGILSNPAKSRIRTNPRGSLFRCAEKHSASRSRLHPLP